MSAPQPPRHPETPVSTRVHRWWHPAEVFAGLVTSLVGLVYSISCAALVYSGPLSAGLGFGIVSALVTAVVLGGWVALRSSLPFAIAGPDTRAAAILAVSVSSVAASAGGSLAGGGVWVTVLASGVVTGVVLWALGKWRASRFIRFIPYPALGGFLAGTGWLLVSGAYRVMTGRSLLGQTWGELWRWPEAAVCLAGLAFALVVMAGMRLVRHHLLLPGLVVAGIAGAYLALAVSGTTLVEARAQGWFFGMPEPMSPWEPWREVVWSASLWSSLVAQLGNLVALAMVMAITILLSGSGLELKTGRDADLDRELLINGWGNLLSGLGGGMAGCLSINRSLLVHEAGGRTRLAGLLVAALCGAVLFFKWPLLAYTPKPLLGGLLLYLGLSLLYEWLVENARRLSRVDYAIVVLILLVIAGFGFLPGMFLGVVVAAVSFAVNYSRINVVKHVLTGSEHRSNVERSPAAERFLMEHGGEIQIFWLHGYLFFGTANRLVEEVKRQLRRPSGKAVQYLILDFARVTGMDSSSVLSFAKMRRIAQAGRVKVLFSRISEDLRGRLAGGVGQEDENWLVFHDVDRALEWCEDRLLASAEKDQTRYDGLLDLVTQQFGSRVMASGFIGYLDRMDVPAGACLCREGEASTNLFFVERGRVSVMINLPGGQVKRLRTMGAGTVVGEMGLILGTNRSAAVVADEPSRVYCLSAEELGRLQMEAPQIAHAFQQFLLRLLARRLGAANREIRALLD